jgi:hypothetical protein
MIRTMATITTTAALAPTNSGVGSAGAGIVDVVVGVVVGVVVDVVVDVVDVVVVQVE